MKVSHGLSAKERNRRIRNVLLIEGASDIFFLVVKTVVGLKTGSVAVLSDAVHSLTDLSNNIVGVLLLRVANTPPDREHPYGHHKYEVLAVFTIAVFITAMAIQIVVRALTRGEVEVSKDNVSLAMMVAVLVVNVGFTTWERLQANRLDSELLRADANHTLSDVAVTIVVIAGWQFAAMGYPWIDTAFALGVSIFVFYLAYSLFKRTVPVLVDHIVVEPEKLEAIVKPIPGVSTVKRVRSHQAGSTKSIEIIASVAGEMSTTESHAVADVIEETVHRHFPDVEVSVHIEPDNKQ